jgi:hypothetical protein
MCGIAAASKSSVRGRFEKSIRLGYVLNGRIQDARRNIPDHLKKQRVE